MPLTGPIPEGGTFFCPHCGALYSVTYSWLSKSDNSTRAEPRVFLPRVASLVRTHALRQPQLRCCLLVGLPFRVRGHPGKGQGRRG
jgi:hypothetical protein